MPSDAFNRPKPSETTELIYCSVLDDGATLSARVHPTRSLCRITYEAPPEHHRANALEELTVMVADGTPEFHKRSILCDSPSSELFEDILYLHAYLPQVIAGMNAPEDAFLRFALEAYVRDTTN